MFMPHNLATQKKIFAESSDNLRLIRYVDALAEATAQEMERDEKVFLFGLDVDDHKAIQGSTAGLLERFGPERVFGTPLSEDAMTGIAVGAAMAGYRPIHVHIRMDFMTLCMNQLINMAAKAHYMYNGQVRVPLVVRTMIGRSWGQGAQHSQALHSLFMHIPGLKVVAPSNAHDAKGCMIAAIRDDNPVIFMEHRLLCNAEAYVSEESFQSPVGKGRIVREGQDITIVAISHMVTEALRAAKHLEKLGIKAEVIDPIWLRPFDLDLVYQSVQKTKNLLVVDNGWLNCGASSEILTQVFERAQEDNQAHILRMSRMGFADTTCPTTRCLEDHFYPNSVTISQKTLKLLKRDASNINWDEFALDQRELESFKGPF
jgi:pyruvate dehydrogenase E1 component beta subunit